MKHIYDRSKGPELYEVFSEQQISAAVERLAGEISADYAGRELLLIVVLEGAFIFAADLARKIKVPLQFDFVRLSSYDGMETTGEPVLSMDNPTSVQGRHVLIVEDIVDTGISLSFLLRFLSELKPATLGICALIDKRERRKVEVSVNYAGLACEGGFLVGYGLDFNGKWRELPAIYQISGRGAE